MISRTSIVLSKMKEHTDIYPFENPPGIQIEYSLTHATSFAWLLTDATDGKTYLWRRMQYTYKNGELVSILPLKKRK